MLKRYSTLISPTQIAATDMHNHDQIMLANRGNKLVLGRPNTSGTWEFQGHQAPIQSIAFSKDDTLVVSADESGQVSIRDLPRNREVWRRNFPPAPGMKVEFAHDNRSLLVMGNGIDLVDWVGSPPPKEGPYPFAPGEFAKKFVDPDGDCKLLDPNEKEGSLKLWVPATPHDMNPSKDNMARMLVDVEGDFILEARVLGAFNPERGLEWPDRKLSYRAGSLIVWSDQVNFLRLSRSGLFRLDQPVPRAYMDFPVFKNGGRIFFASPGCKDEDTVMRIERKGNVFSASWDDGDTRKGIPPQTLNWPAKLKVGVGAINVSTQPFQVAFDGIKLTLGNAKK